MRTLIRSLAIVSPILVVAWWLLSRSNPHDRATTAAHSANTVPREPHMAAVPSNPPPSITTPSEPANPVVSESDRIAQQTRVPGGSISAAFGQKYANAKEEQSTVLQAVRDTGATSARWTVDAKQLVLAWSERWPADVELGEINCYLDGCIASISTRNAGSIRRGALIPMEPELNWAGGTIQFAPYQDEYGVTLSALVLMNPEAVN